VTYRPVEQSDVKKWTVVAGGHSIEDLDLDAHRIGRVVCVNRAFYRFPSECDVWSVMERDAIEMWDTMPWPERKTSENRTETRRLIAEHVPDLWVCAPGMRHWQRFLRRKPGEPDGLTEVAQKAELWHTPHAPWPDSEVYWRQGTTLVTISKLLAIGAKEIRLLGVDLAGIGGWRYPANEDGREYREGLSRKEKSYPSGWWAERWRKEGDWLQKAIAEAAEHGAVIEHVREVVDV
jgi:hypothetical protein